MSIDEKTVEKMSVDQMALEKKAFHLVWFVSPIRHLVSASMAREC
jgi:hypothetical protein